MLDEDRIAALVRSRLSDSESSAAIVRWDTEPRRAGEPIELGRTRYDMPFDGYFVFVDLLPQANWSHPARVVLIDGEGRRTEAFDVEFPPYPDAAYPPRFRTLDLSAERR